MTITLRELIETGDFSAYPERLDTDHLTPDTISNAIYGHPLFGEDHYRAFMSSEELEIVAIEARPGCDRSPGLYILIHSGRVAAVLLRPGHDQDLVMSFVSREARAEFTSAWERHRPVRPDEENILDDVTLGLPLLRHPEGHVTFEAGRGLQELRLNEWGVRTRFDEILRDGGVDRVTDSGQLLHLRQSIGRVLRMNDEHCRAIDGLDALHGHKHSPERREALRNDCLENIRKRRELADDTIRTIVEPLDERLEKLL